MSSKAFFNEAADKWDATYYMSRFESSLKALVEQFDLELGQKVMDVGTGTGVLIPFILAVIGPSGSITAIDYAEGMVKMCQRKLSNFKNVKVELQNVEDLNLDSESFDAITCFGVFPHIEHKEKALKQINRVLKPGGKLIIAHTLSSNRLKSHHMKFSSVAHHVLLEKSEMRRLLNEAGFVDVVIRDEPRCYLCTSRKNDLN